MIHARKVRAEYFEALWKGNKRFELRREEEGEPAFCYGDYLALNEWKEGGYTGRCLLFRITYVLRDYNSCGCLNAGCVALGLQHMPLSGEDLRAAGCTVIPV